MPRLIIQIDLTEAEARYVMENSLERVMNSARYVSEWVSVATSASAPVGVREKAYLFEDIDDCKPIATRLWNAARDANFRRLTEEKK